MDVDIDTFISKLNGRKILTEAEVKTLLGEFEIPTTTFHVVDNPDALAQLEPEFPVVAKICSSEILHKTDVGGVRLDISTPEELRSATEELWEQFPNTSILIEPMEPKGIEVIMGLIQDQTFGPSIMFGLGGIFTEVYKDVTFRVVPISRYDATQMIGELKASVMFAEGGFRGMKVNRDALIDMLLNLSKLSEHFGERIEQMDLNPVFAREDDAVVVDAKLILR